MPTTSSPGSLSISGGVWTRVYTFWFPMPWQRVVIRTANSAFNWKVYGSAPPFYIEGRTTSGFVEIPIGWAAPYCEVHIRTDRSTTYTVVTQGF